MGLMRKLMMGCIPGERILVNTTTATHSGSMPTMVMKVGASYSVSWAGTIPSSNYHPYYLFEILGGHGVLSGMCYAKLEKMGLKGKTFHHTFRHLAIFCDCARGRQHSLGAAV